MPTYIPTYQIYLGILYSTLILLLPWYARREGKDMELTFRLAFIVLVVGVLGSRLFHVFYESWPIYRRQPERIFYVWLGGFVFFGGAIPSALVAFFYLKFKKISPAPWFDFFTPLGAFGYGLGRVSCFFAGCCYGRSCDLPWAMGGRHPTQLYAVIWELGLALGLLKMRKHIENELGPGCVFWTWVFFHALGRLMMERYRDDFRGTFIFGESIATVLALLLLFIAFLAISLKILAKKKV